METYIKLEKLGEVCIAFEIISALVTMSYVKFYINVSGKSLNPSKYSLNLSFQLIRYSPHVEQCHSHTNVLCMYHKEN